jgi:hypothetical protein
LELYLKFDLSRIPVYSGFQFIQDSSSFRIPVHSGFQFIQDSSSFRIPVYSGFQFILDSSLFQIPVHSGFGLDRFHCIITFLNVFSLNRLRTNKCYIDCLEVLMVGLYLLEI